MSKDVVVLSAARSAIGAFGGSLSTMEPAELAGIVMKEAIARSDVDPALIGNAVVGTVIPTDSRYGYVSRVASIQAGLPMDSVAMQVSRLCSSGLQGIVTAASYEYGNTFVIVSGLLNMLVALDDFRRPNCQRLERVARERVQCRERGHDHIA